MPDASDSSVQEVDRVPELPTSEALADTLEHHIHSTGEPHSPSISHRPFRTRDRKNSSASHVSIDHFDPEGVLELRRALTHQSAVSASRQNLHRTSSHAVPVPNFDLKNETVKSPRSSLTCIDVFSEEKFSLENVLKYSVKKGEENDIVKRELGVMFENLMVTGLGTAASHQPTIGSTLNPLNIIEGIKNARHPATRTILSGFEGVVNPGEMLLVLGSPGSGCSTLLKTIANQRAEYYSVEGDVSYSAFTPSEIANRYRGDVTYCPEDDIHFPTLTVEETLNFAAKTRVPQKRFEPFSSRSEFVGRMVDVLSTVFGLRHTRKTQVGDASIRGVSGGEKKRVSIAEALATRSVLGAWDNSTRGLDASTALEFGRALRIATDIARLTTVVSIYQAGESLYELFDKVCVISEGRMVYFGNAREARQYFLDMGYEPANRQTTADFLVSVTDPNGRFVRDGVDHRSIPRTSGEMAKAFLQSEAGQVNRGEIEEFKKEHLIGDKRMSRIENYKKSARDERAKHTRKSSPYTISIPMQVRAVMVRRVQVIKGNMATETIQLFAYVFQAIIMGTVFFNSPVSTSAFFSRGGVLFFAILFGALSSMAEIPNLYAQRPIVARHKKAAMYHPFIEAAALTLVDLPITFSTQAVFSVILYFLVHLQRTPAQFFTFFLFTFTVSVTMKAFFRSLAAFFNHEAGAQSVAGVFTLALVLYTGFTIPQPSMIGALRWITYINPLKYGFESIVANEFHTIDAECATLVPSGPGYENAQLANQVCTTVGSITGQALVNGNRFIEISYGYSYSHVWRNFGILIAFAVAFISILLLITELNSGDVANSSVTLYKRGTKSPAIDESEDSHDLEKGAASSGSSSAGESEKTKEQHDAEVKEALAETPAMTDVFSWKDLNYVVPISGGQHRKLLDGISGYVAPGRLTALMGESGAGKTTLLNVLADRAGVGIITGDRFVNGQPVPHDFRAQTGYCQQTDTHLPETTVREALLFSAKLRQPASVPLAEKEAYVETCLKMCGLENHADAIVGSLGVEHRKRTTIGVELAAKPRLLLFLDEPTSGLDSQSAWAIMEFLRNLANNGQAILCTIHQPSSELFQKFDRLLLLRKGGQTVYFGDLGHNSSTLINYFERNGADHCAENQNPAEWMLDVIGAGATATSETDWHDVWKTSAEFNAVNGEIETIHEDGRKRPPVVAQHNSTYATSWGYQVAVLLQRAFTAYWRNPTYLMAKLALNVAAGLFIGFTFFKAKDTLQGTQNKIFAIFMSTILSVPLSNQIQSIFIDFRNIYEIRERPSRMYNWTAFLTAQLLVEIPWNMLSSCIYFFCWYWTVAFPNSRAGYTFFAMVIVFPLYYTTIAQAVAAMSPNAAIAALLFSTLFSFVITFNGVLQPFPQLGWWKWMYRVSPFTYLVEGVVGQAVGRTEVNCASQEFVTLEPPSGQSCSQYMQNFISTAGGYLSNPDATSGCEFCSARTTDQFLVRAFNIEYGHRWRNLGIVLGVTLFNIAMIFCLTYLFRIRSGSLLGPIKRIFKRKN